MLNVRQGDCFLLERSASARLTMIDVCCGNLDIIKLAKSIEVSEALKPLGNFQMCKKPTNPIDYIKEKGFSSVFRFILSHPDMDHMDGIKRLFGDLNVCNFWDCGIRRDKPDFKDSPYSESDWDFYEDLIDGKIKDVNIVTPRAGSKGQFWNRDDDEGNGNGDYLTIVAPNKKLIDSANEDGDINDASYVIIYRSSAGPIIFAGDSNDKTWEYILDEHSDKVKDAAVLFAPHHGRKSDRKYQFLGVVKPRISFFGCAPNDNLAYSAWTYRKLLYFTNNQCGNIHLYPKDKKVEVYIENVKYANKYTNDSTHSSDSYWYLCTV